MAETINFNKNTHDNSNKNTNDKNLNDKITNDTTNKTNKQNSKVLNDKTIEILLHASDNPKNADVSCPHIEWMGYDLNHCPGIGDWKCKLQEYTEITDQYGGVEIDYRNCAVKEHKMCDVYLNNKK